MSGTFKEGVGDVGRSVYAGFGDAYQAALRAETPSQSTMTGTVEQTVTPGEEPTQSISSAVLEHGRSVGLEQEADHWRQYELDNPEEPDPSTDPQQPDIG
jgi:hypothetical protein